jgi:protease-4
MKNLGGIMNKKRWLALAITGVLLIVYIVTDVLAGEKTTADSSWAKALNPLANQPSFTTENYRVGLGQTIAILRVKGVIQDTGDLIPVSTESYNHRSFLKQLEDAFENPEIKAIVLAVNSPGGGVYESDEIYQKITKLKEKYSKPLVVYMENMAASGGYYISVPADKIVANRYTITGSIGVIMATYNLSELADKIGIEEVVIKSGKNKDIMSPMRDMTKEERQILQGMIDEYYGYFVDVVAEGRNMEREKVIEIADGRIYTATQAKSLGLVDELGDLDKAIATAGEMIQEAFPNVIEYKYRGFDLKRFFSMLTPLDVSRVKEELQKSTVPTAMYLYR